MNNNDQAMRKKFIIYGKKFNNLKNVLQFWKGGLSIAHNGGVMA
jgi:prolipoprotein diacylglyceryltransferase